MTGIEVHLQTATNVKAKNALVVHPPLLTVIADQVGRTDTENLRQGQSQAKRLRKKGPVTVHHQIQSISTEKGNALNH
jgi:hypothetical protein